MSTDVQFDFDARVPMRDGTELSADVYLPRGQGPFPVILQRTPYDNASPAVVRTAEYFARSGYVFVAADVRGRGDSDGYFTPFRGEGKDGADTIEWIIRQPWCNAKVGMMGGSYASSVQWLAARERPRGLVTIVSTATTPAPPTIVLDPNTSQILIGGQPVLAASSSATTLIWSAPNSAAAPASAVPAPSMWTVSPRAPASSPWRRWGRRRSPR